MTGTGESHIFFVDDEEKVLKAVHSTLAQTGAKVSCFKSGTDCLGGLRLQPCDLLITDVKMPVMDGIELIAQARRIKPHLPVIAVTGYGDIPMAVRALKAGAKDFIEKPLERHQFECLIDFMPIIFGSLHISYGLGSLLGLLRVVISKQFWKNRFYK